MGNEERRSMSPIRLAHAIHGIHHTPEICGSASCHRRTSRGRTERTHEKMSRIIVASRCRRPGNIDAPQLRLHTELPGKRPFFRERKR